mgnify:FL=1
MAKCSFCGLTIQPGRGKMFVTKEGRIFNFCSSKCEKNFALGRDPKKVKWVRKKRK